MNDPTVQVNEVGGKEERINLYEPHKAFNVSPGAIRKKIMMLLATKEMTQAEFINAIGLASSSPLNRFMKLKGAKNGHQNSTFWAAARFFYERAEKAKKEKNKEKEKQKALAKEEKEKAKEEKKLEKATSNRKRKSTTQEDNQNQEHGGKVEGTQQGKEMPGDEEPAKKIPKVLPVFQSSTSSAIPAVPPKDKKTAMEELVTAIVRTPLSDHRIMDDCDTVRIHIAQFLQTEGVTMKRFSEALGMTPKPINTFLLKKGWSAGAGMAVYPAAYRFLEKYRIYKQQPITDRRKKDLQNHPEGFPLEEPPKKIFMFEETPQHVVNEIFKNLNTRDKKPAKVVTKE
jgi:hypothetical protein